MGEVLGYGQYKYDAYSGYCWMHITDDNYKVISRYFSVMSTHFISHHNCESKRDIVICTSMNFLDFI